MNKKQKIEREIDKTLEQFDKAPKLPPDPYFYTRLQARLNEREKKAGVWGAVLKPALLVILLLLNITSATVYLSQKTDTTNSARQELISLLSEDFQSQSSSVEILNLK